MKADSSSKIALKTIIRFTVVLIGLFFLLIGLGFVAFPDTLAAAFHVQPAYVQGLNTFRGDMGALFLGMSFFCFLGTMSRGSRWLAVPVFFLLLIIGGRLISLAMDGFSAIGLQTMIFETVLIILLLASVMVLAPKAGTDEDGFKFSGIFNLKVLAGIGAVLVLLSGLLLSQKQIGIVAVNRLAMRIMTANAIADLPDGLHVALIGTGAPLADPRRAGPSTVVIAGRNAYIVDTGPGAVRKLELMKFRPEDIKAVLLTHYHSDHIGDLGELMLKRWAGGSMKNPLDIFGPPGVETVVKGFNLAYLLDSAYRVAHHGPDVVPPSGAGGVARTFHIPSGQSGAVIIEEDGLKVTAFEVDHTPVKPAVGYRFDYKGRSVVISGDTVPCPSLLQHARGVDLLVQEALRPTMLDILKTTQQKINRPNIASIMGDIANYHTTPEDAAKLANEAGVGYLILSHILPPLPVADLKPAFLGDVKEYFPGPITLGEDGMLFSLPAGSQKIGMKWLL